nr:hypothetical protein [Kordiimonas laminariae]
MSFNIPRQARDIINNYNAFISPIIFQKSEHSLHALAFNQAARNTFIMKYIHNVITLPLSIVATTDFLGFKTMPTSNLRGA